jgi:hypothetical protein
VGGGRVSVGSTVIDFFQGWVGFLRYTCAANNKACSSLLHTANHITETFGIAPILSIDAKHCGLLQRISPVIVVAIAIVIAVV